MALSWDIDVAKSAHKMAPRKSVGKSKSIAKLVTGKKAPCAFCQSEVDDELTYGKLYAIGVIQCHYFCVVSSCDILSLTFSYVTSSS